MPGLPELQNNAVAEVCLCFALDILAHFACLDDCFRVQAMAIFHFQLLPVA